MSKRKSKQILKTVCITVLSLVIAMGQAASVQAASAAHMQKLNAKWDLKPGKTVTYKTKWAGVGMKDAKVTIKNYKVSNAKKGYKKVKFTVIFNKTYKPNKQEVHKMANSMKNNSIGGGKYFAIVDYKTGKCLETKNAENVEVNHGDWKYLNEKYYYDDDGCWTRISKTDKVNVTVTYPKDYKNLCIAVGGYTVVGDTAKDKKFWNGKTTFSKTSFYSKSDKSVCHIMRVK